MHHHTNLGSNKRTLQGSRLSLIVILTSAQTKVIITRSVDIPLEDNRDKRETQYLKTCLYTEGTRYECEPRSKSKWVPQYRTSSLRGKAPNRPLPSKGTFKWVPPKGLNKKWRHKKKTQWVHLCHQKERKQVYASHSNGRKNLRMMYHPLYYQRK